MLKKIKFKIEGIHCASCKILIKEEFKKLKGISKFKIDDLGFAVVEFDSRKNSKNNIFYKIEELNYKVKTKEKKIKKSLFANLFFIFLIIFLFFLAYFWISSSGSFELLSQLNEKNTSYWIIFIIGLLASFHCIGMCGGLVIAYSVDEIKRNSNFNKKTKKNYLIHFQYNLARLISYTIIGAILGFTGSFFGINPNFTGIVLLVAGSLMIVMGFSFLTGLEIFKKIKLRTPNFIAKILYSNKYNKKPKGPFVIGLLNGLMPCGPLQAMQIYALTTGNILEGALSMALYGLGTIPMMFGFGVLISKIGKKLINKIIKFSGLLIILLGIIMINRGLNNFNTGINFKRGEEYQKINNKNDYQEAKMNLTYAGYEPNILYIKKGIPVRWIINVEKMTGCTNAIMIESLGIKKDLEIGENIIEFVPPENVKEIKFSCWMRMVWGKFVIIDNEVYTSKTEKKSKSIDLPISNSCNGSCGNSTCGGKNSCSCNFK